MKIISWNVNSVRARIENIKYYIKESSPDILLLQEIKTQNENFPYDEFEKLGYNIKYKVFDCEKYGIPQLRKRLIIVGIRNDIDLDYQFPIELSNIN